MRAQKLNTSYSYRLVGMHEKKELEKEIKKLRIFDEFLLAFGGDKVIFKEIDDVKHLTLLFLKEGILDIHETLEGKQRFNEKYPIEGRERYDLEKLSKMIIETLRDELPNISKEIDIGDPKYMNAQVVVIPKGEVLLERLKEASQIKHKQLKISESEFEDAMRDLVVFMKDLQNYDFKMAYVLKDDEIFGSLHRVGGKYFLVRMDDWEALTDKINKKFRTCALTENSL